MKTLAALLFLAFLSAAAAANKKVLSFGGNGNIGSEVMTRLAAEGGYDITLVSRGNWHFDSALRVMPHVNLVVCDRGNDEQPPPLAKEDPAGGQDNALKQCKELMDLAGYKTVDKQNLR